MKKGRFFLICILVSLWAAPALAAGGYTLDNAGATLEAPAGFDLVPYDAAGYGAQMAEYGLRGAVNAARARQDRQEYVAVTDGQNVAVYIAAYSDAGARRIWSLTDLPEERVREMISGMETGTIQADLYTNEYAFIWTYERGAYEITGYTAVENGCQIMIYASAPDGAARAVAKEIADSLTVRGRANGQVVAGWAAAAAVSGLLVFLYGARRKRPVSVPRSALIELRSAGRVVVAAAVALFINIVEMLFALFADYGSAGVDGAAVTVSVMGLALRAALLVLIFKKDKRVIPFYIITVIFILCANAALHAYGNMAFAAVDVAICVYLLYSRRIAVAFRFGNVTAAQDKTLKFPEETE
jgi:hypothetical protein